MSGDPVDLERAARSLRLVSDEMADALGKLDTAATAGDLRRRVAELEEYATQWDKAAIEFAGTCERALTLPGMLEPVRNAWLSALHAFGTAAGRTGFEVIAPEPGEAYVPGLHRAVEVHGTPEDAGVVVECRGMGFRNGRTVYRPADVCVAPSVAAGDGEGH